MPNEESMYRRNSDGSFSQFMELSGSKAITIQTHNAVSITASSTSQQVAGPNTNANGYMDCTGYSNISLTMLTDSATTNACDIMWSNDGITLHGRDYNVIASGTTVTRSGTAKVKARWAKVVPYNADAVTHTFSAWVYLTAN